MKLSEMLKEDRQKLAALPDRKRKLEFIWDYYKIPILAIVFVAVILITSLVNNIGRDKICMYAVLLNNDSLVVSCDETVFDKTMALAGYDMKKKTVSVNSELSLGREHNETADVETLQVLTALFTISDLDVYVADKQYFDYFADEDGYADLSRLIDQKLLNEHGDDLYYYTGKSGNRVLAGIILHQGSVLHKAGYYHDDVIIGISARAEHLDEALDFLKQILSDRN